MKFLSKYDAEYSGLLEKRAKGFRKIFRLLESMRLPYYLILETGTTRDIDNWAGDGQSTRLFDAFVNFYNGIVFSIDVNPQAIATARSILSSKTHLICSDSVKYLHDIARMANGNCNFDLIYLDSHDLDFQNPELSSYHHMKEFMAIGRLKPGTIVAIDDNLVVDGKPIGKGRMVHEYLSNIGVPLVYDGYQKIWQIL